MKLSVQQYTFRPWSNQDGLFPVLERISAMGYTGLEMCCFGGFEPLGMDAKELKSRLADLGISMIGNHFTREMFISRKPAAATASIIFGAATTAPMKYCERQTI